jgi:hypothetical protein
MRNCSGVRLHYDIEVFHVIAFVTGFLMARRFRRRMGGTMVGPSGRIGQHKAKTKGRAQRRDVDGMVTGSNVGVALVRLGCTGGRQAHRRAALWHTENRLC